VKPKPDEEKLKAYIRSQGYDGPATRVINQSFRR
jgi:hypothetical protein